MDLTGKNQIRLTKKTLNIEDVGISSDGTKILYNDHTDKCQVVNLYNLLNHNYLRLSKNNYNEYNDINAVWSPNNDKIVFSSDRKTGWQIFMMNADGTAQIQLTDKSVSWSPAWSPDGNKIAYESDFTGKFQIYIMDTNGKNQQMLTNFKADNRNACWSHDSSQILFESVNLENVSDIYLIDVKKNKISNLTKAKNKEFYSDPVWSPSDNKILYSLEQQIYIMNRDGTSRKKLTNVENAQLYHKPSNYVKMQIITEPHGEVINTVGDREFLTDEIKNSNPSWLLDGSKIVFQSNRDDIWEIYIMDEDGNNQKRLTNDGSDNTGPWWY
jgi:TolB protein